MPAVTLTVVGDEMEAEAVGGSLRTNGIKCAYRRTDRSAGVGTYVGGFAIAGPTEVLVDEAGTSTKRGSSSRLGGPAPGGSGKMRVEDGVGGLRMASIASSVREAGVGEVAQVSATLADALANDPVFSWLLPSQRRRDTRLRRLFALELAHWVFPAGGRALTTNDFRGANVELPPGGSQMSMSLSGAIGLVHVFGIRLRRAGRLQVFFDRNHPKEPHYYVRTLGVATRFQRQGLGTALLRPTLDRCDQEGVPAYLEASSERSAALYERLGFVHLGELRVPDGGPPFWPMRRPPAAA